jgi:MSHA pilin protein MshC
LSWSIITGRLRPPCFSSAGLFCRTARYLFFIPEGFLGVRLSSGIIETIRKDINPLFGMCSGVWLTGSCMDKKQSGFTLIELIMVMVIAGILAAVVAPRFFDANVFKSRGFADQVQATLRYAQKEAIAQHRNVCVTITANSISLKIASTNGAVSACDKNLVSPTGQPSNCPSVTYKICTPSVSITLASNPSMNFNFDALGSTPGQQIIAVSGATNNIVVEAETGYVHSQ